MNRPPAGLLETLRLELPEPLKAALRLCRQFVVDGGRDLLDVVLRRRQEFTPPRRLLRQFDGSMERYRSTGAEFSRHFVELCGLQAHESVLDVGCGIGRMAVPLTRYLRDGGEYHGFDVMPDAVKWCRTTISPRYPNFHFRVADVYNSQYNPKGKVSAKDFRFPYGDGTMDFAMAISVFTHMTPEEVENFLAEMCRVLRGDGRALVTCFLLDEEASERRKGQQSAFRFSVDRGRHLLEYADKPAAAVAFREEAFLEMVSSNGLRIVPPIHFGAWSGRQEALSFQDVVRVVPAT